VKALESSAAVFTSIAKLSAIIGITGSTARVNNVCAKTTSATIFRTGGMGELAPQLLRAPA
jgi:hypothetical protein